ncbi:isochorismatase family protein [Clostridioides difficile]
MVLLIVDTQKLITNEKLYKFHEFVANVESLIDTARKNNIEVIYVRHDDGVEHGFNIIVPAYSNTTVKNSFMSAEQSYKYYNEFIWNGRYAECISLDETFRRMK